MQSIGVDIGGVIINVPTRITPDMWAALKLQPDAEILPVAPLIQMRNTLAKFPHVCLVSAATDAEMRDRILSWLEYWHFWQITGVPKNCLHFCDSPSKKGELCREQRLRPDVFVDDTPAALASLEMIVPSLIFFDRREDELQPEGTVRVTSWGELDMILRTL
jgi:hypothetical protein